MGPALLAIALGERDRVYHVIDGRIDSQQCPVAEDPDAPAPNSTSVGATLSPIVRTTSRDLASIRRRVLSSRLPTQTEPSPTAGPAGLLRRNPPTIVPVPGSMTATDSPASCTGTDEPSDNSRTAATTAAAITSPSAAASENPAPRESPLLQHGLGPPPLGAAPPSLVVQATSRGARSRPPALAGAAGARSQAPR